MRHLFRVRAGMAAVLTFTVAGCGSDGGGEATTQSDAGTLVNAAGAGGSSASGGANNAGSGGSGATNAHAGAGSGGSDAPDARANPSVHDAATTGDAGDAASSSEDGAPPEPMLDAGACQGPGARFVTTVVDHHFGTGQTYGQDLFPAPILGPPQGGGECQGGFDVVALGNGGDVTVAFEGNAIVDGPGPDFIVFENAFGVSCDLTNPFAELATVSVSQDGSTWVDFPCTETAYPYGQCSGWHVIYANSTTNAIDATDPTVAGGDAFDLGDVGLAFARYVKITDRADLDDGVSGVYDLDGVAIVNALCP